MKRLAFYILLAGLGCACQKEGGITPGIGYENLYVIADNPDDSVQHKRYELYAAYGVPVYFNDTIGKVFVTTDMNGDSVFRYETLDLNWAFSTSDSKQVTYQVVRLTEPAAQMNALRFAEVFLENTQPALHPYALWLTKDCYRLSSAGVEPKELICRYRNIMFSGVETLKETDRPKKAAEFQKEVIKLKVQNFGEELAVFNRITDEKYYSNRLFWSNLYPDEILPRFESYADVAWYPYALAEEWQQDFGFRNSMKNDGNEMEGTGFPMGKWTDEDVDNYIAYTRRLVGAYGFVSYKMKPYIDRKAPPANTEQDLELYLEEMMKYPRKEFLKRWEGSPLVLKKYEILYAIIRDELGVEL